VIFIDSPAGDLFLEKDADIRRYRLLFDSAARRSIKSGSNN
jgi:hypothetical protein